MADRPILFSAPMVRALLNGRKTQTRRFVKPQPFASGYYDGEVEMTVIPANVWPTCFRFTASAVGGGAVLEEIFEPRINEGDRLWVREAWRCNGWATDLATIFYRASECDGYSAMCEQYPVAEKKPMRVTSTWRPGIHLPRWASRLTLTVTDVRVERLHDISEADAVAEGCFKGKASGRVFANEVAMHLGGDEWSSARDWYADLWDDINGAGAWDANPWVAAYTFTVEQKNIDEASP